MSSSVFALLLLFFFSVERIECSTCTCPCASDTGGWCRINGGPAVAADMCAINVNGSYTYNMSMYGPYPMTSTVSNANCYTVIYYVCIVAIQINSFLKALSAACFCITQWTLVTSWLQVVGMCSASCSNNQNNMAANACTSGSQCVVRFAVYFLKQTE